MLHIEKRRFAGFSLYVSKTGYIQSSTLCYKNGPQLLPLNFTTICTEYGRYVIFYNERMDGVSYPSTYEISNVCTELCEVSVKGKLFLFSCAFKHKLIYILEFNLCNYWFIYFVDKTSKFRNLNSWPMFKCQNSRYNQNIYNILFLIV